MMKRMQAVVADGFTAFHLKMIAIVTMLLDHMQVVFPDVFSPWLRVAGRLAFPLFVFLLAEGFRHTRSRGKFLLRLAIFAVASEPFFDLAFNDAVGLRGVDFLNNTNIFYTLLLGGAAITVFDYIKERWHSTASAVFAVILCCVLAAFLGSDYGEIGVAFIFVMYVVREDWRLKTMFVFCLLLWLQLFVNMVRGYVLQYPLISLAMVIATCLAVPLAARYNKKRGPDGPRLKWLFYAFYPAHIAGLVGLVGVL
ncbi:MAG: conjugal transfer protein TraX [Defluviitaleaceae bacterium]|nr:conjugal transfer protein TraX [Defluviitaleaceae bacterium]